MRSVRFRPETIIIQNVRELVDVVDLIGLSPSYLLANMLPIYEIYSLTDFLGNHKAHGSGLKTTQVPEVLTVNGKAEVVVQDAASYQRMRDRLRYMETLAPLKKASLVRNVAT